MAWLIQHDKGGYYIVTDINISFGPNQIRDLDLIGRDVAEKSNDLKNAISTQKLKEIRKDAITKDSDPAIVQMNETLKEQHGLAQQQAQRMDVVEKQNEDLKQQNMDLKQQNIELKQKMDSVLDEVKSFADKFPIQIREIAEAMRNIQVERAHIAEKLEALPQSGASDIEIKTQERILALKEKKLEKNVRNLGNTISHPDSDIQENLDALDALDI